MVSNKNWKRWFWLLLLISILSLGVYLLSSYQELNSIGFPLDDAWIHQTYARNFAEGGQWAYLPGITSGGSTSPLWTILLSIPHLFSIGPYWGTYVLGLICFFLLAFIGQKYFNQKTTATLNVPLVAIILVFEWHLCWSAVSGMETILHALLILLVLYLCLEVKSSFLIGLIIGVSVWVRPDGVTLLGPLIFVLLFNEKPWKEKLKAITLGISGFIIIFIPYLVFNKLTGETWMPNTFYAKQAEYAVLLELPIWKRMGQLYLLPLVGVGIFLLPGFIYKGFAAIKERDYAIISSTLWLLGYILIYAIRLPVIYQHGRYIIPAMPVYFVLGAIGSYHLFQTAMKKGTVIQILTRVWSLSAVIILGSFWWMGANSYSQDVAYIEEQMVETSHWINENLPQDGFLAAHDIGALGYFSSIEIVDLAGLITPDVVPFIRNEPELWRYLEKQDVSYLMTFPDWYVTLPESAAVIYQSKGDYAEILGGSKMIIYQLRQD